MDELLFEAASDAADQVRRREVSSRELTEAVLDHVDAVDPQVNAVTELRREAALEDADAADRSIDGDDLGTARPLLGVPMTVKDGFHVAGLRTTWGNPAFQDIVADRDATVVHRLKQAGAIVVGKTNVPFMLADFGQTANEIHGVTNNPWASTHSAGGSSGGAAAAVAAGMSFLEYGSDLVGSIRIPASFCGVYGLKPSADVVPVSGFQPPGPPPGPSEMTYMSSLGPLGRSAADLRTALSLTGGPEGPAANAYEWTLAPPRHTRLEDFRVGAVLDDDHASVTSEVGSLLADTVDAIAKAGAAVVEGWPQGITPTQDAATFGFHVGLFLAIQQPGEDGSGPLSDFIGHEKRRMAVRAAWARYFQDVDVLLCPVNFTPPFPHDPRPFEQRRIGTSDGERAYDEQAFWVAPASLAGLPAVSAPIGTTAPGLPVGVQIIGPFHEDDTAITFAELLADVVGGYQVPPLERGPAARSTT